MLLGSRTDEIAYDHQPRSDADAGLEQNRRFDRSNCNNQLQPCPYCPLGVILMSLRYKVSRQVAHCPATTPAALALLAAMRRASSRGEQAPPIAARAPPALVSLKSSSVKWARAPSRPAVWADSRPNTKLKANRQRGKLGRNAWRGSRPRCGEAAHRLPASLPAKCRRPYPAPPHFFVTVL